MATTGSFAVMTAWISGEHSARDRGSSQYDELHSQGNLSLRYSALAGAIVPMHRMLMRET